MISPNAKIILKKVVKGPGKDKYGNLITSQTETPHKVLWAWGASSIERGMAFDTSRSIATIYCFDVNFAPSDDSIIVHESKTYKMASALQKWSAPENFGLPSGVVLEVERVIS